MSSLAAWFAGTLGRYISKEAVVFIVSLLPLMECRAGLLVASLLQVPITTAIPLSVAGNILPIPFILLLIKTIFKWMRKVPLFAPLVDKLEQRALNRSSALEKGEFLGLLLFVGIPLPGTGGWTGSLLASLLEIDLKKASLAILLGILLATLIMSIVSYGLLGAILS